MHKIISILLCSLLPAGAIALEVKLDLEITNGLKPLLVMRTNLPPKTELMASLLHPINRGGNGYIGQKNASVGNDGTLKFGPFTNQEGKPVLPGTYRVVITSGMMTGQPSSVQKILGSHGENISGDGVKSLPVIQGVSNLGNAINMDFWTEIR